MKRFFTLALAVLLLLGLAACGKDYSARQFNYPAGEDFRWDMTVEEAVAYIEARPVPGETDVEVHKMDTFTTVTGNRIVFHFDEDGKLSYVRFAIYSHREDVADFRERYGQEDAYEESYNGYLWYGTLDGQDTVMTYSTNANYDVWLEFTLA